MSDITRILQAIQQGEPQGADQLLPLVYHELRRLATRQLANEPSGQTLQATALVHEAYLRLAPKEAAVQAGDGSAGPTPEWESKGHFYAAAAQAMRRILVDRARKRRRIRHGGDLKRIALVDADLADDARSEELLALDDAMEKLEGRRPEVADLVKLRYFAGLTLEEAAAAQQISPATASRYWTYARSWLYREMSVGE